MGGCAISSDGYFYVDLDIDLDISIATVDLMQELTDVDTLTESDEGATALIGSLVRKVTVLRRMSKAWVKVFRINPEFRILRLTFHRKSAPKC